jgi:hypothetical protein
MSDNSKEREILGVMRTVLSSVIKDITPAPGMKHPLSGSTVEDVKNCFKLIAVRERELAQAAGIAEERPYFSDDTSAPQVVSMPTMVKKPE